MAAREKKSTGLVAHEPGPFLEALLNPRNNLHFSILGSYQDMPDQGVYEEIPDYHRPAEADLVHRILFIVDGRVEATIGDYRLFVERGSIIWIPSGAGYRLRFEKKKKSQRRYDLPFRLRSEGGKILPAPGDYFYLVENAWEFEAQIKELIDEQRSHRSWRETRMRAMLTELLVSILRRSSKRIEESPIEAVKRLMTVRFMEGNLNWRPTPGELATEMGFSQDYFSRIFRRTYGVSPKVWITQERLRMTTLKLIDTNMPIGEIAKMFGYENAFLFSRQFKKFFKVSPREYRLKKRY